MSASDIPSPKRNCEVCDRAEFRPYENHRGLRLERCLRCGFLRCVEIPSFQEIKALYDKPYYRGWGVAETNDWGVKLKKATFKNVLSLAASLTDRKGALLDIGCATGLLMEQAEAMGWTAFGIDLSDYGVSQAKEIFNDRVVAGTLADHPFPNQTFEVITMIDLVEHDPYPLHFLKLCAERLAPGGLLVIGTPDASSFTAKLFGRSWHHIKFEHLYYWSSRTIMDTLRVAGFEPLSHAPFRKKLNLEYIKNQLEIYPNPVLSPFVKFLKCLPKGLRRFTLSTSIGEMIVIARKGNPNEIRK